MKELRSRKKHPLYKKGIRQYLALFLSVCLTWVLLGCISGSKLNTDTGEPTGDFYFENGYSPDDDTYGKVYSQSEASSRGGLYIKKGDDFIALDYALPLNSFHEMYESAVIDYDISRDRPFAYNNAPTLNRNDGDQLVTFTAANSYESYQVKDEVYCFPAELNTYWSSNRSFDFVPMFNSGWEDTLIDHRNVEEVNGSVVSSKDDLLDALGQRECGIYSFSKFSFTNDYIFSDYPSTITCGYYNGTDYIEKELNVNVPLYVLDNEISLSVVRGKEGYFTIDTDPLFNTGLEGLCVILDPSYAFDNSTAGFLLFGIHSH